MIKLTKMNTKKVILAIALGLAIGSALFIGLSIPLDQTYNFGGNEVLQKAFEPYINGVR